MYKCVSLDIFTCNDKPDQKHCRDESSGIAKTLKPVSHFFIPIEDFDPDEAPFLREADYPAKAWTGPSDADKLHFDSMPLSELSSVREFV